MLRFPLGYSTGLLVARAEIPLGYSTGLLVARAEISTWL